MTQTRGALFLAAMTAVAMECNAAPGQIDPTFGIGGMVLAMPTARGWARFVSTDTAGNILATGIADSRELIVRWRPDGTHDLSFNGTGFVHTPAVANPNGFDTTLLFGHEGLALFPEATGGWLAIRAQDWYCGLPFACANSYRPRLVGTSIGANGLASAIPWSTNMDFGTAGKTQVMRDSDTGITVVSSTRDGQLGSSNTRITRNSAGGEPDPVFDANLSANATDRIIGCRALISVGERRSSGKAVRLPDGKLLLAQGIEINPNDYRPTWAPTPNPHRLCISRFHPDGRRVTGYANQGDLLVDSLPFSSAQIEPVALHARPGGGHLLVLQRTLPQETGSTKGYTLVWLNEEGRFDTRYANGQGYTALNTVPVAVITAATTQPDGYILLAGYPPVSASNPVQDIDYGRPVLMRLHLEGGIDLTFGPTGGRSAELADQGKRLHPNWIHVAGDGSIVVAGAAADGALTPGIAPQFAVLKLQGGASPALQQPTVSSGASSGGGGGCGITRDARVDPTWLAILLLAAGRLWQRASSRRGWRR